MINEELKVGAVFMNVLVVDQAQDIVSNISEYLEDCGHSVLSEADMLASCSKVQASVFGLPMQEQLFKRLIDQFQEQGGRLIVLLDPEALATYRREDGAVIMPKPFSLREMAAIFE